MATMTLVQTPLHEKPAIFAMESTLHCKADKRVEESTAGVEEMSGMLEHMEIEVDAQEGQDSSREAAVNENDDDTSSVDIDDEKRDFFDVEDLPAMGGLGHARSQHSSLHDAYRTLASSATSSTASLPQFPDSRSLPRRAASAPPAALLLEAALRNGGMSSSFGGIAASYIDNYSMQPYNYSLWQPAFPQMFDIFDYGDGFYFYLGGGGRRITRHLSRRNNNRRGGGGIHSAWPFENPPLYACRLNDPSTGLPPVVLYGGPNADQDGAWADVQFGGALGRTMTIGLPPLPKLISSTAAAAESSSDETDGSGGLGYAESDEDRAEEKLGVHFGWHNRYRFTVEVGAGISVAGRTRVRETFEWRYCSAAELEALSESNNDDNNNNRDCSRRKDDSDAVSLPPRPSSAMSMVGGAAGRFFRQTWRRRGLFKRSSMQNLNVARELEKPSASKKAKGGSSKKGHPWRGGWQLVRLANATAAAADPLAAAIKAAEPPSPASKTVDSSSTTSTTSTVLLDQLIGEEAGLAAERRRTSDGREIVATWANVEVTPREQQPDSIGSSPYDTRNWAGSGAVTTTAARFTFMGSGKSGQLGERWALMAVATGLAIWERERRARRRRQQTVVQACGGLANIG